MSRPLAEASRSSSFASRDASPLAVVLSTCYSLPRPACAQHDVAAVLRFALQLGDCCRFTSRRGGTRSQPAMQIISVSITVLGIPRLSRKNPESVVSISPLQFRLLIHLRASLKRPSVRRDGDRLPVRGPRFQHHVAPGGTPRDYFGHKMARSHPRRFTRVGSLFVPHRPSPLSPRRWRRTRRTRTRSTCFGRARSSSSCRPASPPSLPAPSARRM